VSGHFSPPFLRFSEISFLIQPNMRTAKTLVFACISIFCLTCLAATPSTVTNDEDRAKHIFQSHVRLDDVTTNPLSELKKT